jgi:hypothetical protein
MPKSRGRKKLKKSQPKVVGNGNRIVFRSMNFGGVNHAEMKQAVINAARADVEKFPELLSEIYRVLKERTPEGILATFAFYGSRAVVGSNGEMKTLAKDIQQHHIELLQGIVLTLPAAEWGQGPSAGDVMQIVFDTVPELASTFFKRRLIANTDEIDADKRAIMSLQEKIRLHTQVVRNWGYFNEVKKICREVYSPLDAKLKSALGFTFTDIIDISEAIVNEIEARASRHMKVMSKIFTAKDTKTLVKKYWSEMPGIKGSPDDFFNVIPEGTSREGVMGALMSHADLRHFEIMLMIPSELAALTEKEISAVEKILKALSISPGELEKQKVEHLFLANPVWGRPGIKMGDSYLFAIPQAIFSHINEIMWNIAKTAKIETELSDRRASFLEDKTVAVLQSILPTAHISKNAKWNVGGQQFETDVIAVVDKTIFLAEAKSHRLTPEGLRGAPDRLKKHLSEIVVAPSIQSERLANHIIAARAGEPDSLAITKALGLDADKIDQIIRISVTLDDLSVLSSSEEELIEAGLIPEGHMLAPSLHVADLCCISDILSDEIPFLHYFAERFHFQKLFDIFGDELDFLGMYISTGFNLGTGGDELRHLMLTGLSDIIDRYYEGTEAGLVIPKPKPMIHHVYKEIIDRLASTKPEGWTTIGIHLLSSASPDEQKKVERGLATLKQSVLRKNPRPEQKCFMQIIPPLNRKATVGFFVHRAADRLSRRDNIEQFAAEALEREEATSCVIFAKNADNWAAPYEGVLLAQKQGKTAPELRS